MNAQTAYAMITQVSPLFQVMSLPVSTLAANEMAARASMYTPRVTLPSTAKAVKTGRETGVLSLQALRSGGPGGPLQAAKPPYPAGDELIQPDGLAADHLERIGRGPAGGCGDGTEVGLLDQRVEVDALDEVHHEGGQIPLKAS